MMSDLTTLWKKTFENIMGDGENAGYIIQRNYFLFKEKLLDEVCVCVCVTFRFLAHSQTSPGFYVSFYKPFENTVGKGEIARNKQFLLFPQRFLPILGAICRFHRI